MPTLVTVEEVEALEAAVAATGAKCSGGDKSSPGQPLWVCLTAGAECNRKAASEARRLSVRPPPRPAGSTEKIPHRMWFTALRPLVDAGKMPITFADNVLQIMRTYVMLLYHEGRHFHTLVSLFLFNNGCSWVDCEPRKTMSLTLMI